MYIWYFKGMGRLETKAVLFEAKYFMNSQAPALSFETLLSVFSRIHFTEFKRVFSRGRSHVDF